MALNIFFKIEENYNQGRISKGTTDINEIYISRSHWNAALIIILFDFEGNDWY
jgi:hypothetical protein